MKSKVIVIKDMPYLKIGRELKVDGITDTICKKGIYDQTQVKPLIRQGFVKRI